MNLYENELYLEDIKYVADLNLPWGKLQHKTVLLSGATGLIGSFLIDVLMTKNKEGLDCMVYALGRNGERAKKRFSKWENDNHMQFISYDINKPFVRNDIGAVDYIFHLASNTHPLQYSVDPIGTITTNIIGLQNMLEFAIVSNTSRFVFASSVEIYGENRGEVEKFNESYLGYIDCNTLRAGYPESKRCGEALCQAYLKQYGLDIVIPRLSRVYGPTMLMSDTKALSQFILNAVTGENIVLKSIGNQFYSYIYVPDAVSGVLKVLLEGVSGEAYNIADEKSDITLKELAQIAAMTVGTKVVFDTPDVMESVGYSKATVARLESAKLQKLGWKANYDIFRGVERTIKILKSKMR